MLDVKGRRSPGSGTHMERSYAEFLVKGSRVVSILGCVVYERC